MGKRPLVLGFYLKGGKLKPHAGSALCGASEAGARGRLHNEMLRGNGSLLAGVADDLVRFAFGHDANSVVRADEDHLEAAVG